MTSPKPTPFVRDRFTWLAYFMLAYYGFTQAALGPLMPFLRTELNLSYTATGLHLSAFAVGMVLAGLIADRLVQRWGRWFVFWGGGVGMALGTLALALGNQILMTLTSTLIMGSLGTLLLIVIQTSLANRYGEQRVIALTESNFAASICASLAPIAVGGFQQVGLSWRGALILAVIVLALIAVRFHREAIPGVNQTSPRSRSTDQILPIAFWAYWIVIYLGVSIEWCLIFWGPDFLEKVVGLSQINAATMMSIFFVAMVLGRFVGSRLSRVIPGATLLLVAIGITLIGFPLFWLPRLAPLNLAGLFITGLGVANLFPLTLSVAFSVVPQQTDVAAARVSLAGGLAILMAPFLLGWLADQLNIQNAFGIVALLAVIAAVITFSANRLAANQRAPLSNECVQL